MNAAQKKRVDYERRVMNICFDNNSVHKIRPGLKMIFSHEDSPVFVKLNALSQATKNNVKN